MKLLVTCQYNQKPHLLDGECEGVTYVDLTEAEGAKTVTDELVERLKADERFLLRQQAHGVVMQASLAVAIEPSRDLSGRGDSFLRSLRAAYDAGYYRKPMPLAVIFGRHRPAVLTPAGHRWVDFKWAGFLRMDQLDDWLKAHGLGRVDFRHLVDR